MRLVIIGGVAGGASAAARARRINEKAEIILIERGEYISFANCGLPYHIGGTIPNRESLLVMTPKKFKGRANIDIRTKSEATAIDRQAKTVSITNLETGESYSESYDKLIIATGGNPFRPPVPGGDDPEVPSLWTIPDLDKIMSGVGDAKSAVVIGAGFIGIEAAENLIERGIKTSLIAKYGHVLPQLDPEMARPLAEEMAANGIDPRFNTVVEGIEKRAVDGKNKFTVKLSGNQELETDLVIMAIGMRPNSKLAKDAGLELGVKGCVAVDEGMRTADPDIFAVGDVAQVINPVTGQAASIPLAGPANKQGRIAADNAFGAQEKYRGSLGTFICKVFSQTAASAGPNETALKSAGIEYLKTYITAADHASYYPGAETMVIKALFAPDTGKILGAQAVGGNGVDKRIDLLATAIRQNMTIHDLKELELAYAPPYGAAKDPVNFVGFVGENMLSGLSETVAPDAIPENGFVLDVREPAEVAGGTIPDATHIPLGQLRGRLGELPKDKVIHTLCKVGGRAYLAERILKENGFQAKTISGGYTVWKMFHPDPLPAPVTGACRPGDSVCPADPASAELDACGLQCPGPIVSVKNKLDEMKDGETLRVKASDAGFYKDLPAWCESTGNLLMEIKKEEGVIHALLRKGGETAMKPESATVAKRTTIVLFSNDLDKAMAAFIIATGFASLGHEVSIFCTFWGLNVLRKDPAPPVKKDFLSRMFGMMMPRGAKKLALSKMHMMGMGTAMMKHVMNSKNIDSLPALIGQARMMGVKLLACEMAMTVMGIQMEELLDGVESAGVANFAALAEKSGPTLFI